MKDSKEGAGKAPEGAEKGGEPVFTSRASIDQKLNPDSPAFDPAAYQEALEARGGLEAAVTDASNKISDGLESILQTLKDSLPPIELVKAVRAGVSQNLAVIQSQMQSHAAAAASYTIESLQPMLDSLTASLTAGEARYQEWVEKLKSTAPYNGYTHLLRLADNMPFFMAGLTGFVDLVPQLGGYLEAELAKPEYEGLLMGGLVAPMENDPDTTLWEIAVANAEEAMKAAEPDRYRATKEAGRQQAPADAATITDADTKRQLAALAPLASMPNGEALNLLFRVYQTKRGRVVTQSPVNRHEEVTAQKKGDKLRFTRTNKQTGTTVIVEIDNAGKFLGKNNSPFEKLLRFTMQKMTAQNFPLEVGFSLQELVDLGIYANTDSARKAFKSFFDQQKQTTISGAVKKGKRTIKEEGGVLFFHYKIRNGFVRLSVNENFNMEFIAPFFTVYPTFAYSLSNTASSLVGYIFYLARQNSQAIKDKGNFTINLDAIRGYLGLPAVDEVKNWKYKQYIITPIEEAIEEIEEALLSVPEAKDYGFTITPRGADTTDISEWLQGYLEIGLKGDFAKTFVRLATKAEKDRDRWERAKLTERARQAVKEEAKATKEREAEEKAKPQKGTRGTKETP